MWTPTYKYDYLCHHGILGMKWGKKNGPPYPLDAEDHSQSEKKAGWRKSLSDEQKSQAEKRKSTSKAPLSNEEIQRKEIAKKVLIGLAVTGTIAASCYVAYKTGAVDNIVAGVRSQYKKTGIKLTESELKNQVSMACKKASDDVCDALEDAVPSFSSKDDKYILKAGSYVHHLNGHSDFDMSKVGDRLYASFTDDDVAAYKSLLNIRSDGSDGRYDIKLKLIKDLVLPNEEKTKQIVNELLNDKAFTNKLVNSMTNYKMSSLGYRNVHSKSKQYKSLYEMHRQRQLDLFNSYSNDEKIREAMWSIVRNDAAAKSISNAFKEKGFNAVLDFNDKNRIADSPIILLDPKSSAVVKGKNLVNNIEIKNAAQKILNNKDHPAYKDTKDLLNKIVISEGDLKTALKM